jgi:hypothetical protein
VRWVCGVRHTSGMHPAYIRHTASNDITVATSSIDASVRLDPTRQRLVVAQLSLNAKISSTACDVRTRHARSLASTHRGLFHVCRFVSRQFVRLPVRQFVSRQFANPPTHISLFFRTYACVFQSRHSTEFVVGQVLSCTELRVFQNTH